MYTEEDLFDSVWGAKGGGQYIFFMIGYDLYCRKLGSDTTFHASFTVKRILPNLGKGWVFLRKIKEEAQCAVLRKIKQMEQRQTWQRNQQS